MAQSSVLTQFSGQFSPRGGKDGLCHLQLHLVLLTTVEQEGPPIPSHLPELVVEPSFNYLRLFRTVYTPGTLN